nr:phospholipase-like protein [Tanacetum cinerariifolium]
METFDNGPSHAIESNLDDFQNRKPSVAETRASSSTILSKPSIKFVKAAERPTETKIDKVETVKKTSVKYAEMYKKTSKRTVNVVLRHTEHHLAELKENPNFNATYNLYGFAWGFNVKQLCTEVLFIKRHKDDEFDELTKRFSKLETFDNFIKFKNLLTNDLCTKKESSDCNQKNSDGGMSIEEKPNFSSHHNDSLNHIGGVSSDAKASSSSAHLGNDEDVSHLDDNMEIDGQNVKAVVPTKVDDHMLHTIKPKDDFDEADVDSYDDDYMSLFNDEEQRAKSSLNNLELQQEPDKVDVKDGILEQQPNADKGKTTVIQETIGVKLKKDLV